MSCEICGRILSERSMRITVEGLNLTVCHQCSEYGEVRSKLIPDKMKSGISVKPKSSLKIRKPNQRFTYSNLENYEVVEDFSKKIKEGRERKGISQEQFAKYLKERLSVIQKIETGKIVPNIRLSHEIEHLLKIKLLSKLKTEEKEVTTPVSDRGLTIGDVIHLKKSEKV